MEKLTQKFWLALASVLGFMAVTGIIFMIYQVFIMGEIANFAIG